MKPKREVELLTEGERTLVRVPLGRKGEQHAELYKEDFDLLMELGLSSSWRSGANQYVIAPAALAKGANVSVARVLLDAGPGSHVKYRDGDHHNLRRDNIYLAVSSMGVRRDRDFLRKAA